MRSWKLLLAALVSLLLAGCCTARGCTTDWFGPDCQYRCHCATAYREDGSCTKCRPGWFGPACQYADLAYNRPTTPATNYLTDGDDKSCINNNVPKLQSVFITLDMSYLFTWMRLHLHTSGKDFVHSLKVFFGPGAEWPCENARNASVDDTTLDIHCDQTVAVQKVTLTGQVVGHLCSVYISGGRNVALKQNTSQSSTYSDTYGSYPATKAVDGNTDGYFYKEGHPCASTDSEAKRKDKANWNVTLDPPTHVTKYVLYNRDGYTSRLQKFYLQSFGETNIQVFNYTDTASRSKSIYPVVPDSDKLPVTLVNIQANNRENILTLCEVEIYGDSSCDAGRWGRGCEQDCRCAAGEQCFVSTGGCPSGCAPGFQGESCQTECPSGRYGSACSSNCSQYCLPVNSTMRSSCHHVSGACHLGCQGGYTGNTCSELSVSSDGTAAQVGVVVGCLLVVLLVTTVAILLIRKRRLASGDTSTRRKKNTDTVVYETIKDADVNVNEKVRTADQQTNAGSKAPANKQHANTGAAKHLRQAARDVEYNNLVVSASSTSVLLVHLPDFLKSRDRSFFENQFREISANESATMTVGLSPENKNKNRYKNICTYDHSRVHLVADPGKNNGDYINASFVQGYRSDERFIAAQGPTKIILEDFIRMLWEQSVEKVVMLTNLVEDGKQKCECYWPDEGEVKFGEITVTLAITQMFADYTIRRLQLRKKDQPVQHVTHFHFTAWPDRDVPTGAWGLVDFEQKVASYPTDKPVVVHCSAGVGRTGTFIALRNVMREAEETGRMDFFSTVQKLRQDRVNMVQTADQYIFLHNAALVAILCIGTTITSMDIEKAIVVLNTKSPSGHSKMEAEFRSVCSACDDTNEEKTSEENPYNVYENSQTILNRQKNRDLSILPKELYRAKLRCENNDVDDYINAVLVPSFSKQNQQILTQLPLPSTLAAFWRLVTQYKVTVMVAFQADLKSTDPTIADYLPQGGSQDINLPMFKISTKSQKTATFWRQQEVSIAIDTSMMNKFSVVTNEHHLTHLACTTTNLDKGTLLAITQQIRSLRPAGSGRTLYMCRNGAEYSGLVCVMSLLLDRMDNDHHLTIPLVVGAIKAIRPQVIPSLDQYELLYEAVQLYGESFNEYTNFGGSTI